MNRATRHFVLLAALATLLPAQTAQASPIDVIRDCADSNSLEGSYSDRELREARGEVPSDLDEYSDCASIIAAAIGKGPTAGASSNGGDDNRDGRAGGSGNAGPAGKGAAARHERERRERRQLASLSDDIALDGGGGGGALTGDDASSGTPLPLVLALIALLCLGGGAGVWYAARRNPAVANALRRVSLPGKRG